MAEQTGRERRWTPGIGKRAASKNKVITVPGRFRPRFWEDSDQRIATVRAIRKRYETLVSHTQADSIQKDMLVQRACFLSIVIETMEVETAEGNELDLGVYTQACNALQGILMRLGLDKRTKNVTDLQSYLKEKETA